MSEAGVPRRERVRLREVSRLVPGVYAWVATVLFPIGETGAPLGSRLAGMAALGSLLASLAVGIGHPRLARAFGVHGFLFGCLVCWVALGFRVASDHLDPVRGALGALGFLLHTLAWGAPPAPGDGSRVLSGSRLVGRKKRSRGSVLALGLGIVFALLAPGA